MLQSSASLLPSPTRTTNHVPRSYESINSGDDIAVVGKRENIEQLANEFGWQIKPALETFAELLANTNAGMAEVVVAPRSELIDKTSFKVLSKVLKR